MSTLETRLQDPDYKNWVKSAFCLSSLKRGLEEFVDIKSLEFHQKVLRNLANAKITATGNAVCGTKTIIFTGKGPNISGKIKCGHPFCQGFLKAIIQEGIDPNESFTPTIGNIKNTNVSVWHSKPWEVSKLFMNPGQKKDPEQTKPSETDLSGLINFVDHCRVPRGSISNTQYIVNVRDARNAIMHSASMMTSAAELQSYAADMMHLLEDPSFMKTLKGPQAAVIDIKEIQSTDFEITLKEETEVFKLVAEEVRNINFVLSAQIQQLHTTVKETKDTNQSEISRLREDHKKLIENLEEVQELQRNLYQKVQGDAALMESLSTIDFTAMSESIETNRQKWLAVQSKIDNLTERMEECERQIERLKPEAREITKEDEEELEDYLKKLYTDPQLQVPVLPGCYPVPVMEMFAPVIVETTATPGDPGKRHEGSRSQSEKKQEIKSYKNIFYDNNSVFKRVFLQGKAGSGKSTFCRYLVAAWCGDGSQGSAQYPDVDVLKKEFKYLFYVQSRFAGKSESLIDMIFNQLIDEDSIKPVVKYVLKNKPDQCLVINDGLDEWKGSPSQREKLYDTPGLPSLTGLHNCTVLTTSRPWRIHALPRPLDQTSRLLEFQGLKDQVTLVRNILSKLKESEPEAAAVKGSHMSEDSDMSDDSDSDMSEPEAACRNFFKAVEDSHMSELTQNPLLLIHALTIWRRNKSLSSSVTDNYCHILNIFIEQSKIESGREGETYEHTDELCSIKSEWSKYKLPDCFQTTDHCKQYAGLLIQLGELAFQLLFREKHEQSLVFSDQEFPKSFDKKSLDICLKLGLLSQARAPGRGIEKMSNYSFPHKTFHEFMAALWLSISYSEKCRKFQECCKTLDDVFDFSVLIKFVCGLAPEDGAELVRYIGTEMEEEINKHRVKLDRTVGRLHELIIQCVGEARCFSGESGQQLDSGESNHDHATVGILQRLICCASMSRSRSGESGQHQLPYYLPDVCIDRRSTKQVLTVADNQLRHDASAIKSVYVRNHDDLCRHVVKCMKTMTSVLGISLESEYYSSRPALSGLELPQQLRALRLSSWDIKDSAVSWPSCLSLLDLSIITLTHDFLQQLPTSLSHCPHLQKLVLSGLSCSDHGGRSCLPGLGLQTLHRLETLRLSGLSVESLSLPGQQETHQGPRTYTTSGLDIDMCWVNMTPQGWRSWVDSLVHLSYQLTVILGGCNIDQDTRSYISSCPHFTVTRDDDDDFNFETKLKATDTSS